MLNIHTMPLGALQANCYLVWADDAQTCAVIDPGDEAPRVLEKAASLGKTIQAVLLTHGHFDHVGGAKTIVEKTGCQLWMQEGDWSQPLNPFIKQLYPLANANFCEINFFEEGEQLSLAGTTFTVLQTPGHSWGSVCIAAEDALFTGDTLFAGGCGRTDMPGGDWRTICQSLQRLSQLECNYRVYPGHGESSTLLEEKNFNPYMRR